MKKIMLSNKLILLLFILIILTSGCTEKTADVPAISSHAKTQSTIELVYPKAAKEWDKYIGLFQKDAVSVASRKHNWPDDNAINYVRSYSGRNSGDEHLGYVWQWVSQSRDMVFISGMINDSGITNVLIHNKNKLTIDEILLNFTNDEKNHLLGESDVDYFTNIWTDYTTESKQNLDSDSDYPVVLENQKIDLLTYTDHVNCQQVYWINGQRRGAKTDYFKQILSNLQNSISNNNLDAFKKQLPEVLNMECTAYFEEQLYSQIFSYESKLGIDNSNSRKVFLKHMLDSGSSNVYAENNFCQSLNHAIFKQQNSPDSQESIELAELLLNNSDTNYLNCSLATAIRNTAQLNQPELLLRLIEIEASNSFEEAQSNFQYTLINALESAAEVANIKASELLIDQLSNTEISDYSSKLLLIAAGKSSNIEILNLLLKLNLTIDDSQYEVIEAALETGNPEIVKKLFEIGFVLPTQSYALESLLWSTFKYNKSYQFKHPTQLFNLLKLNGLVFSNIEEKDRSILMSRVYTFAHAAWVDIDKNNANLESAMRYKQSVMALTQTYINQVNSIDFQYGRKNQTLLMNAVAGNLPEVVELILQHKPNLELKNKKDQSALDIATQEARIYILGSRKDFAQIYKTNAQKIVSLLGGDISIFKGMIK